MQQWWHNDDKCIISQTFVWVYNNARPSQCNRTSCHWWLWASFLQRPQGYWTPPWPETSCGLCHNASWNQTPHLNISSLNPHYANVPLKALTQLSCFQSRQLHKKWNPGNASTLILLAHWKIFIPTWSIVWSHPPLANWDAQLESSWWWGERKPHCGPLLCHTHTSCTLSSQWWTRACDWK